MITWNIQQSRHRNIESDAVYDNSIFMRVFHILRARLRRGKLQVIIGYISSSGRLFFLRVLWKKTLSFRMLGSPGIEM